MNVDHDSRDPAPVSNDEKFTQLLTEYITHTAPHLFALCQDPFSEDAEGWVFAWGAAFDDSAVLFSSDGRLVGTFSSAHSALDLFSRIQKLCLIWVDPIVRSQPDTIEE